MQYNKHVWPHMYVFVLFFSRINMWRVAQLAQLDEKYIYVNGKTLFWVQWILVIFIKNKISLIVISMRGDKTSLLARYIAIYQRVCDKFVVALCLAALRVILLAFYLCLQRYNHSTKSTCCKVLLGARRHDVYIVGNIIDQLKIIFPVRKKRHPWRTNNHLASL